MKNIADIDKNFKVETKIQRDNLCFFDAESEPFRIYGVQREGKCFCRMPGEIAKTVSEGVYEQSINTAGGRVRFVTDSPYVAISAVYDRVSRMPHFALTGSAGFDLYYDIGEGQIYKDTFVPPYDLDKGYESVHDFPDRTERIIIINLPLYSNIEKLYIGLDGSASLKPAPDYRVEKPVVFYGSSITQGGCASRPGNSYQSILSRKLDCNFLNLGFSGNAMGEDEMTEYICGLDMQAFVLDYDHNAPTLEHLEATHSRMFKKIRAKHPNLPILILSRPKFHLNKDDSARLEIINKTYKDALAAGDKNVYFISGPDLIEPNMIETATVDNCHPNDSGFVSMAEAIYKVLKDII